MPWTVEKGALQCSPVKSVACPYIARMNRPVQVKVGDQGRQSHGPHAFANVNRSGNQQGSLLPSRVSPNRFPAATDTFARAPTTQLGSCLPCLALDPE